MASQPSTFPLPDLFTESAIHTHLFPQTPSVSITLSLIKKFFFSNKPLVSSESGHSPIPKKEPPKNKTKTQTQENHKSHFTSCHYLLNYYDHTCYIFPLPFTSELLFIVRTSKHLAHLGTQ